MTAKKTTPAKASRPDVRTAARSQDVTDEATNEHRNVFVVPKNPHGDDYDDDMHARNIDATRQAMVNQGLRPTSDGEFVGAENHQDGQSVCLTYAVACAPAGSATAAQTQVRISVTDQHDLERQTAGELDDQGHEKAKG